tara:strand:+ start:652 stop:1155 length:504 start_codon:yes stop_codon:yes gene_type:complete
MSELRTNRIVPRDGLISGTHNGGGIIQVRQAVHSEYVVYTANSFSAGALANGSTGNYSITITPTRADSKILVSFSSMYDSYAGQRTFVTIYRSIAGGTASNIVGGRGLVEIYNPDQRIQASCMAQYLDSPNTTSAITYTVYATTSTGSFYLGLYNNQKYMHAMEVSG